MTPAVPARAPLAVVPSLDEIARDPTLAERLSRSALVALYGDVAGLEAALRAQLLAFGLSNERPATPQEEDEWISQDQAEQLLGVSSKWFARRKNKLPFVRRLSRRKIVISKNGLMRWIATRTA